MINELLALISSTHITQKNGVLACWPAASNSPAIAGCVMFFDCEMRLHLVARRLDFSL